MTEQPGALSGSPGENGAKASSLIRTYVVRSGRMTEAQRKSLEDYGPSYIVPFARQPFDAACHFAQPRPLVMEIGFGMGKASWQIARDRPEFNYLGVEVHGPGVGKLIMELRAHDLDNFRIVQHDAVEVMEAMIPEGSLAGLHIFYPDPWPKKRHHKRRLLRQPILDLMVSRLKPGGYLYFVTDIEEYGLSTLELLSSCPGLSNRFQGFASGIDWRPETKFEARAKAESRSAFELYFVRTS
jgi:tRNA (guanine-N7-)-methyltransferase